MRHGAASHRAAGGHRRCRDAGPRLSDRTVRLRACAWCRSSSRHHDGAGGGLRRAALSAQRLVASARARRTRDRSARLRGQATATRSRPERGTHVSKSGKAVRRDLWAFVELFDRARLSRRLRRLRGVGPAKHGRRGLAHQRPDDAATDLHRRIVILQALLAARLAVRSTASCCHFVAFVVDVLLRGPAFTIIRECGRPEARCSSHCGVADLLQEAVSRGLASGPSLPGPPVPN